MQLSEISATVILDQLEIKDAEVSYRSIGSTLNWASTSGNLTTSLLLVQAPSVALAAKDGSGSILARWRSAASSSRIAFFENLIHSARLLFASALVVFAFFLAIQLFRRPEWHAVCFHDVVRLSSASILESICR